LEWSVVMLTTVSSRMKTLAGITLILMIFYRPVFSRPDGPTPSTSLPAGPGAERVKKDCLTGHRADLVVQNRLTRAGWTREVDKMIRWGAAVPPDDREVLIAYLSAHYGDPSVAGAAPSSTLPAGPGADRVSKACLTCHEADII